MADKQTFEQFKERFLNTKHINAIEWVSHGNHHQRHFYMFDGTQITVHTYFPYSFLKNTSTWFEIDCIIEKSKENKLLLKKYNGVLNDSCLYTEEENVALPQFKTDDDMLKFMYEVDYKSLSVHVTFY
jgi:hypothetical protein